MNYREIPTTAVEVQTGLWANARTVTLGNVTITKYDLYSAQGYCFYFPENSLDEEGNLLPEDQRVYYIYAISSYRAIDQVNAAIVSVPYVDGYEVAGGVAPDTEVM